MARYRADDRGVSEKERGVMKLGLLLILPVLPSLAFMALMVYAFVDAESVRRGTQEAWNHERDSRTD